MWECVYVKQIQRSCTILMLSIFMKIGVEKRAHIKIGLRAHEPQNQSRQIKTKMAQLNERWPTPLRRIHRLFFVRPYSFRKSFVLFSEESCVSGNSASVKIEKKRRYNYKASLIQTVILWAETKRNRATPCALPIQESCVRAWRTLHDCIFTSRASPKSFVAHSVVIFEYLRRCGCGL